MMEKKTDFSCCSVIFFVSFALLAIYIFKTISDSFLELLKAAGLCLGVAGILFALFIIISLYSVRLIRKSRDFSLRCYPVELQIPATYPLPPNLPEAPGQETILPLFLLANLTNYGLRLAPHPLHSDWKWFPADNAARFNQLSDNLPGRLVIPTYSINLYYRLITQQGNLSLTTGTSDAPGFSGDLPASLGDQALEIIIVYTSICDPRKLNLNIARAQPLKLRLVALDKNGQDDPAATCKFYNKLWNTKKPIEQSNDDDDSWMYRSRPTMPW
jgi:hypothetical protein